jgi:hypothetical protein
MIKKITFLAIATLFLVACGEKKNSNSNLQEAEQELVKLGEKDGMYLSDNFAPAFTKLILSDTSTISYPFQQLIDSGYVSITTSQDGNLRFYDWVEYYAGNCVFYDAVFQYRSNGKVFSFEHRPWNYDNNNNYIEPDEGDIYGCAFNNIHTVIINKEPYYLVETWIRYDGSHGVGCINAFAIENDKLKPINLFKTKTETLNSIDIEYSFADWYFRANSDECYEWLFAFEDNTKTLYVPLIEGMEVTDQYLLYQLKGNHLEYKGKNGGFWLHSSIRKFNSLVGIYDIEKFKIRIDNLGNGYYRYVSWTKGKTMADKPDLIIENGKITGKMEYGNSYQYVFENQNYIYSINLCLGCEDYQEFLLIEQNGKQILGLMDKSNAIFSRFRSSGQK